MLTEARARKILQNPAVSVVEQSEGGDCLEIIGANRNGFFGFSAKFINVELSKKILSKIHLPIYQKIHLFRDILALPNVSSRAAGNDRFPAGTGGDACLKPAMISGRVDRWKCGRKLE
jgi:hypothetical protein